MSNNESIEGTVEAWEQGELGRDEKYAKAVNFDDEINKALKLKLISIRLQESLIDDLKKFAILHGVGYQALTRYILQRWVEGESKMLLQNEVNKKCAETEHKAPCSEMEQKKTA